MVLLIKPGFLIKTPVFGLNPTLRNVPSGETFKMKSILAESVEEYSQQCINNGLQIFLTDFFIIYTFLCSFIHTMCINRYYMYVTPDPDPITRR